ncbi:MAG: DedA family protein [Betaproteobacteria bacterium]|jgi:membrane-associated protein|nr:DedA family protein [Betaproteobacteria bacterium]MDH5285469.1 DedA family protein [Betaproteobacteria bacterium]
MVETLTGLVQAVLALDETLAAFAAAHGPWLYALLFAVIFAETGLVVTPFLPGDSLLFVAGTVVAGSGGALDIHVLFALLWTAAVTGDSTNYWVGRWIGPRVFERESRWIRREHLERTQAFYDRYGAVTIVIGRFMPIVRTFAPFLAGVASLAYRRFVTYSVLGSVLWVGSLLYAGYLFGNIPWVKSNLSLIVVLIVIVSVLPAAVTFLKEHRGRAEK